MSAGTPMVSTATPSVESQKNAAGQRGPRRSAMRAWTNVNVATTTGTRPSATSPTPSRNGLVPMKLCADRAAAEVVGLAAQRGEAGVRAQARPVEPGNGAARRRGREDAA